MQTGLPCFVLFFLLFEFFGNLILVGVFGLGCHKLLKTLGFWVCGWIMQVAKTLKQQVPNRSITGAITGS